ncbi:MAG: 30S ribosomal protein S20 [Bdellovibrionales bacterium]|nr:30S ribosomal protein S20 [Bdellovibrionales bacterium]
MANHKSAAKRARQSQARAELKSKTKSSVRTSEKKLRQALEMKDRELAQQLLPIFASKAGKAAQKGAVNPKAAARKVGRLSRHVHQLVAAQ